MGTQSLRLLDELDPELKAAWLDNVTTLFTFRAGAADAMELARELNVADEDHLSLHASDIVGLPDHACFVRVRDRHRAMTVFRVETRRANEGDAALYEQIVNHSRETYGRDAALVDTWLQSSSAFQFESDLLDNTDGPARFRRDQKVPPMPTNTANRVDDVSGDGPTAYAQEIEPETDLAGELEASTDVAFVDTGEVNHG